MAAYFFFDVVDVKNPEKMEQYRKEVVATVEKFKGRYILIGGPMEILEGNWKPVFPVMIEFPRLGTARQWYASAEYAPLKRLRMEAAEGNTVLMQGL